MAVADGDPIDEQGDQLPAVGKGQVVKGRAEAVAKGLDAPGQGGHSHLVLRLEFELGQWLSQSVLGLRHLLGFTWDFLPPENGSRRDRQQAGLLPFQLCHGLAQRVAPGVQGVRQPLPTPGPCQFMSNQGGLGQYPTEVLPHKCV